MRRTTMDRRDLMVAASLAVIGVQGRAGPPERSALPRAVSLTNELRAAIARRKCLVVMVSLQGCPICRSVRESHLFSLAEDGQPIVQVEMLGGQPLQALDGTTTTHGAQVLAWNARVAPTVLFLGRAGVEVAERLDGGYLADFYGAYLAQRLSSANATLA